MRLLHTADWHLGRTLEGRSRLEEQAAVLDEIVRLAEEEAIDVVLLAGDVFDSVNPPAAAEQLFYETVARLADKGRRPVVVIAGNHDNPDRLTASTPLAQEQGIVLLGYPVWQPLRLMVPSSGEALCLAALPYPSEARLNELLSDSPQAHLVQEAYDVRVKHLFQQLAAAFSPQTVNVAMSHLFVAGGQSSDSERPIEVGGAYTVQPTSLPAQAQYVALGHLHRPQAVRSSPVPARYAGSPLAYSFSEAGYAKSVTVVDVRPGEPADVKEIHLTAGRPLVQWRATEGLAQVYRWMEEGRDKEAWIDLEVHVQEALMQEDIYRLRQRYPNFVHIRPVYPEQEETIRLQAAADMPIDELFRQFYRRQTGGAEPEEELVQLFLELLQEEDEAEVAP